MVERPSPGPGPEPGQDAVNNVPDWIPAQWHNAIRGFLADWSLPERGRAQLREGLLDGHRVLIIGLIGGCRGELPPGTRPTEEGFVPLAIVFDARLASAVTFRDDGPRAPRVSPRERPDEIWR